MTAAPPLAREVELARQAGPESRSVRLSLTSDGRIEVDAQDMGPAVKLFWGDSDYEFGIRIAAADVARLAHALIVEHYTGDLDAVRRLSELCKRNAIEPNGWSWA